MYREQCEKYSYRCLCKGLKAILMAEIVRLFVYDSYSEPLFQETPHKVTSSLHIAD